MIKSEQGTLTIEGMQGQILMDFAHIYDELINIAPEVVAATVLHFGGKLEEADMDNRAVKIAEMLLSHLDDDDEDEDDE